jgi:hypothetical protein
MLLSTLGGETRYAERLMTLRERAEGVEESRAEEEGSCELK